MLTFTDGTTATWTQTFSDWNNYDPTVAGQVIVNKGTNLNQLGNATNNTANLYGYSFAIPDGKALSKLTLPTNNNVGILGIALL